MAKQIPNLSGAQATTKSSRRAPALFDQKSAGFFPELTEKNGGLFPELTEKTAGLSPDLNRKPLI
jgi:hypothetical protein